MKDGRWEQMKELFAKAIRLPAEKRGEFLDAACAGDPSLRAEVEALLAAHDEVDDGTEDARATTQQNNGTVFPVEGPGTVIGHYRLLEKIGEGGMGVVYLAEQQAPVRRRVALKIIKLGMDTREVVARFEAERQALALMDHNNIAKVFDAGTTELGRPYFVMEYVAGAPITEYCDRHRLSARERLELFVPVCQAIHHAHQRAIIHRDVKPTNVLVTEQDGKPVPKVIDFGVARATNRRLTEKTIFTGQGVLIGTLAYMSPEQAGMTGLDIDTTTDVYSLGATLYELLSGAPPFDPRSLREAGLEAMHRMLREVDPPKPSTRVGSLGGEATTVAERRRTRPASLERQIRGELDWITMRAMEKDRKRRYPSASELAADIERHLRGEPVAAGPPGAAYRLRKFARRNRTLVASTVAAVVVLSAFAVTMTIQAGRIARERDRAQQEAARSHAEAEMNQAFFRMLLRESDADEQIVPRVREVWQRHREALAGSPATLALQAVNLLPILDYTGFRGRGDAAARDRLKSELEADAFDLIDQSLAARDTTILETIELMLLRLEDIERMTDSRREKILEMYRGALELCEEALPGDDRRKLRYLNGLADYLEAGVRRALSRGDAAAGETGARELVQATTAIAALPGQWPRRSVIARGLLGECLLAQGRFSEAEPMLLESLEKIGTRDARLRVIELYEAWGKPDTAARYREGLLVENIRDLGTVGTLATTNMEGGFSAMFADRSVWVFVDALLTPDRVSGNGFRMNRWAWTDDFDASDGVRLHEPAAGAGRPLLPLTDVEKAFNIAHLEDPTNTSVLGTSVPTEQWALFPLSVVSDPPRGRALVVYRKVHMERVYVGGEREAGRSIAVWEHPDSQAVRPAVRPGSEYPTLLFQGDDPPMGKAALVDGDFLYLYGQIGSGWESYQIVARARLDDILDRSAWRFFAGDGRWVPEWQSAVRVLGGLGSLSVHWNAHLGRYVALASGLFGGTIAVQTADRPEGKWASDRAVYSAWRPDGRPVRVGGAVAHPELERAGGRVQYITYYRPTGFLSGEVRLLEMDFR